eukprot:TRINITY_DN680815_c1_g1_i1.p1 TRINITY_DN680815_c1_g1~~TRINITY_DN680815_c1_g1_i1.p1  ORF type:complete len:313 (-),score=34.87 TRINITY_DN680815_c1_g1_i1:256-1194(-)
MMNGFFIISIILLFSGAVFSDPSVIIFSDHESDCNCSNSDYFCRSNVMGFYDVIESGVGSDVSAMQVKNFVNYGNVELRLMDDSNYWKYLMFMPYESKRISTTHCDNFYLQMEYESKWHIIAQCTSFIGCDMKLLIISSECAEQDSYADCTKYTNCGWCESMNYDPRNNYCVPGNRDGPDMNIQCDEYTNFYDIYGKWIILALVMLGLVCLFCCFCVCYCCTRSSKRRRMRRQCSNNSSPVIVMAQPQQAHLMFVPNDQREHTNNNMNMQQLRIAQPIAVAKPVYVNAQPIQATPVQANMQPNMVPMQAQKV